MQFAHRISRLGTETAFEVLARAKALEARGKSVIHLEIGEPDFDTPRNIISRAQAALNEGFTHYGPSAGLMPLKEAIAAEMQRSRGFAVSPEEVIVTPGGKPIMFFAILALINEGDEVIYPNPGFPIYESMIEFVGGKAIACALREDNDFRLDPKALEKLVTPKTKMLIINSPQNPTGGILTHEDLQAIADVAKKHNLWVLSDEIYSRITYDWTFASMAAHMGLKDRLIILDGFSKTFAMTGWRLGYGVMCKELAAVISRLQTNSNSCTASFTQMAGVEALQGPQTDVDHMVGEFRKRRDLIVSGLNAIAGVGCKTPLGAFYVFPNFSKITRNTKALADHFLEDGGVACLAGNCFGKYGEGYLRFSYANSLENIEEALRRLRTSLDRFARS